MSNLFACLSQSLFVSRHRLLDPAADASNDFIVQSTQVFVSRQPQGAGNLLHQPPQIVAGLLAAAVELFHKCGQLAQQIGSLSVIHVCGPLLACQLRFRLSGPAQRCSTGAACSRSNACCPASHWTCCSCRSTASLASARSACPAGCSASVRVISRKVLSSPDS